MTDNKTERERLEQVAKEYLSDKIALVRKAPNGDKITRISPFVADFALIQQRETKRRIARELREQIIRYKTPRAQIASIEANVLKPLEQELGG